MAPRLRKYARLFVTPACWPALTQGVAATLDHDIALGQDRFATVIDVGANKGQFATFVRLRWLRARLICFEPLPGPRAKLIRVTQGKAEIHDCALGTAPGQAAMHLASRHDSSSLLPLGERQKAIFGMDESGTLTVPVQRLDAVIAPPVARPSLLKIDVQGFELESSRARRRCCRRSTPSLSKPRTWSSIKARPCLPRLKAFSPLRGFASRETSMPSFIKGGEFRPIGCFASLDDIRTRAEPPIQLAP